MIFGNIMDKERKCYKCNSEENLELLTDSSWWSYFYKCTVCNRIYKHTYGDKMGGQADDICISNIDEVNACLTQHPQWYKIQSNENS